MAAQADACVVGVDVGGTRIKAAVLDRAMRPLVRQDVDTAAAAGPDAVLDRVAGLVERLAAEGRRRGARVEAAGVVVPGVVDERAGTALYAANLRWHGVRVRERLAAVVSHPLAFGHDVRAGALAESRLGAARGVGDVLFVAIGTGIAGALVVGGEPYARPYAGELGYLVVEPAGPPCACGNRGGLEAYASAAAIADAYRRATGAAEEVSAADVARRVAAGEPAATAVWGRAVEALATAVAACMALVAPELVVLGGGLSRAGTLLLDPLAAATRRRLTFQPPPRLEAAALGDRAGCLGAGLLAWERAAAGGA